ncbi:MAG TPA: EamA family transporter [Thermoleophilaceae bacterium]|nr:EamA family transporter [Thermoleophilaceae bacterium]
MSGGALAFALGAAFLHALWNVLLAGSRDSVAATGALLVFGVLLLAPAALLVGGDVSAEALPFVAASAVLELAYFVLLARAYRGGELGVVYPVARGSAPVLVLGAALIGLGKGVSWPAAVGVLLVAAGVLVVGVGRSESRRSWTFGMAIGVAIAGYTLVDSEGLEHADPLPYLFLVTAAVCVAYNGALLAGGRAGGLRAEMSRSTLVTAAATFGAYAMVLAALQMAPAAPVAAVRESSIVIAALLAWLFLGEQRRLGGAALVAAGVALIGLA